MTPRPTMFIGSSVEGLDVANAVQDNLWRDILISKWDQDVFTPTKNTLEELAEAVNNYDFAVFILSRDDASVIRKEAVSVVRDNVVLEAGMFIGKLGRERVFLIVPHDEEKLHLPTDLLGTTTLEYDALRPDNNWVSATSTACNRIRTIAKRLGGIRASKGVVAYGDTVVLVTFDGCYVQVAADERGTLTAISRDFGEWDKFEIVSATGAIAGRSVKIGDKISLKAVKNNRYVGVDFNNHQEKSVGAWVPELKLWETFEACAVNPKYKAGDVVPYGVSFALLAGEDKAAEGGYVAYKPEDTKTFWAASATIGDWERLMFVEPE